MNFPADHPMHRGWQFTTSAQNPLLAEANVVLVLDCDIPYIPGNNRPAPDAAIYVVDVDPLKYGMSLWHVPARRSAAANSKVALEQIAAAVRANGFVLDLVESRRAAVTAAHDAQRAALDALEHPHIDTLNGQQPGQPLQEPRQAGRGGGHVQSGAARFRRRHLDPSAH